MSDKNEITSVYFKSLIIENLNCFKDKYEIDFSNGDNKPAQWTVILGNNNTGKTTLLRVLADLEPNLNESNISVPYNAIKWSKSSKIYLTSNLPKFYVASDLFIEEISTKKTIYEKNYYSYFEKYNSYWRFWGGGWDGNSNGDISNLKIYAYGTSRRMSTTSLSENTKFHSTESLFSDEVQLTNAEEWLLQMDYAIKNNITNAKERFNKIKEVLVSGILPDVKDFECKTDSNFKSFVEFKTDYGLCRLKDLGYGYQSTIAWIVDLAKNLFERYPDSEKPLNESAVVLVDEIDLHLHPDWQRKIISFLSTHFPNIQFIVTCHSPLIVQSSDNINLILLEKVNDSIVIKQPNLKNFKGWTVEEILTELMGLGEKTHSDEYLSLIKEFDTALDTENYNLAKNVYEKLNKILHPESNQRKLLRIQMSSLLPE